MTSDEIEVIRQKIRSESKDFGEYYSKTRIYDCYEMVNSILAYSPYLRSLPAEEVFEKYTTDREYLDDYIKLFGKEKVIEIIAEQLADIETVRCGVYTDGEGCSYNSIVWRKK